MHELSAMLRSREVSSVEITRDVLARIAAVEPQVEAYITVMGDDALKAAEIADKALASGQPQPALMGIPLALKDNVCTRGTLTTCASTILANFVPPYDATVAKKLRDAGSVFVGKTNMDEFAMGSSTENSGFKKTANPWDLGRIPGGSSGGSAAAVAADMCIAAVGTDTGGSIRQPAACCGVVGMKPTYGAVSRYGVMAFASSLDQVGPLTKDVEDAALMMNALAGHDPMDSTSSPDAPPDYTNFLNKEVKGLRIGIPKEFFGEGLDAEVASLVRDAIAKLEALGAVPVEVELPTLPYGIATYYLCATAEASSNLARYIGMGYGARVEANNIIEMYTRTRSQCFGPEVKRRIMLGAFALSAGYYDAYYMKALRVRTLIKRDFDHAFAKCDLLVGPTMPTPAFRFGEKSDDPLAMYLNDIYTITTNLAGIAGISLPCGFSRDGLPVGLQIIAPAFEEGRLFTASHAYEQSTEWHRRKPTLQ